MKKQSSLERKMLSYFGLIAAASLLITVEFVYAIQGATPEPEVLSHSPMFVGGAGQSVISGLHSLRNKALLMCVVQAAVTLTVLIMFMRRITGPLQHMVDTSIMISDGDLSRTIRIRTGDEIGLLGETINGLTSNIQEIVALGLSTEESLKASVEKLRSKLEEHPPLLSDLEEMDSKLMMFEDLMSDFKLLPAPPPSPEEDGPS